MKTVLSAFISGFIPIAVEGGYDFVDVRDVAHGIVKCCQYGRIGECYILAGHYCSIKEFLYIAAKAVGRKPLRHCLPLKFIKRIAPLIELLCQKTRHPSFLTQYSAYILGTNANFSSKKAVEEIEYRTRDLHSTRWV
jgi:dihydroflavonol-4-reductase